MRTHFNLWNYEWRRLFVIIIFWSYDWWNALTLICLRVEILFDGRANKWKRNPIISIHYLSFICFVHFIVIIIYWKNVKIMREMLDIVVRSTATHFFLGTFTLCRKPSCWSLPHKFIHIDVQIFFCHRFHSNEINFTLCPSAGWSFTFSN